jgi:hypothetical protein
MIGTYDPGTGAVGSTGCGSKAKPIVNATANGIAFAYLNGGSDWRIAGIDFRANHHTKLALHSSSGSVSIKNILAYRNTLRGIDNTFVVDVASPPNYVGIVGNHVSNITNQTWYGWGHGIAVMGNNFGVTCCGASGNILNVLRFMGADHAVISNNTMVDGYGRRRLYQFPGA